MSFFALQGGREHQIRLSFSYVDVEKIERGIAGLRRFVHDTVAARTAA
jgi:DNA-binding transcriptional MocR family regulator